jgi:hypothetical protein
MERSTLHNYGPSIREKTNELPDDRCSETLSQTMVIENCQALYVAVARFGGNLILDNRSRMRFLDPVHRRRVSRRQNIAENSHRRVDDKPCYADQPGGTEGGLRWVARRPANKVRPIGGQCDGYAQADGDETTGRGDGDPFGAAWGPWRGVGLHRAPRVPLPMDHPRSSKRPTPRDPRVPAAGGQ